MAEVVAVDVEALVVAVLRADPDLAAVAGLDVSTELPNPLTLPRLRVFRRGGVRNGPAGWLDAARITVESWHRSRAEAFDLAALAHGVLIAVEGSLDFNGTLLAVVTGVEEDVGLAWSPDPDSDIPRELFGVIVYCHPVPA